MVYGEGQELKLYEAEDGTNWPEQLKRKSEVKKRRGADNEMETLKL